MSMWNSIRKNEKTPRGTNNLDAASRHSFLDRLSGVPLSLLLLSSQTFATERVELPEFDFPGYAMLAFSDLDGDGTEELLSASIGKLTVSSFENGNRTVEWRYGPHFGVILGKPMLVGDIDGDLLDELIFFDLRFPTTTRPTMKLIQWAGESYAVSLSDHSGDDGVLVDVDGDGDQELLMVRPNEDLGDSEGLDPDDLWLYDYGDGAFRLLHRLGLPYGITNIAAGDVDGDGREEVIVEENAFDGSVEGRIAIYAVTTSRFERLHEAQVVPMNEFGHRDELSRLGVFEHGGVRYLLMDDGCFTEAGLAVRRIVVTEPTSPGTRMGLKLEPDDLTLSMFADAIRSLYAEYSEAFGGHMLLRYDSEKDVKYIHRVD